VLGFGLILAQNERETMRSRDYLLTLFCGVLLLGCPKKDPEAPVVFDDVVPEFFSTPYGCNALLLKESEALGTKIDENSYLLAGDTKFQWLPQGAILALLVVITNEEQLKSFYSCAEGFPPVKVDFEKSRIYLLYIQHQRADELAYLRTNKKGTKMQSSFSVKKVVPSPKAPTSVDIFAYIWPEEVRGMSVQFKYKSAK
jgi:hypothetical protein